MLSLMAVPAPPLLCRKFQAASDLIGRRWTPLILRQLQRRPRRYAELARALQVMSERMLIQRLKELERAGIVERRVLAERPVGVEYALTRKGQALGRVLTVLQHWADEWIPAEP